MTNHTLTREDRRRGGSSWSERKAASVGRHFEEHNDEQRAAALARYGKIKLLRDADLSWPEVAAFLGETENSVKSLYYKIRPRVGDPVTPRAPVTHCKRGHELSGPNLYTWNGVRGCKTCRNLRERERRRRRAS